MSYEGVLLSHSRNHAELLQHTQLVKAGTAFDKLAVLDAVDADP
jgi:hypothetical protein